MTKPKSKRNKDGKQSVDTKCGYTVVGLLIKKEPDSERSQRSNHQLQTNTSTADTSNVCVNCKDVVNRLTFGKCQPCHRYARMHNGQERPAHVIERTRKRAIGDINKNKLCTLCNLKPVYYIGKCAACYSYSRCHNGENRPAELIQIAKEKAEGERKCIVCKSQESRDFSKNRCGACYSYFKLHNGEDRPQHLIKRSKNIKKKPVVSKKCISCKQMTSKKVSKKLCNACYLYKKLHNGQPRPEHLVKKPEGPIYKTCIICKVSTTGRIRLGKCNACYNFPRKHNGLERDTLLSAVKPTTCSVCKVEVTSPTNMRIGKCIKCYKYGVRHNGEAHPSTKDLRCIICDDKLPAFCKTGKCLKCYMYAYRNKGEDRPPEQFNVRTKRRTRRTKIKEEEDTSCEEPVDQFGTHSIKLEPVDNDSEATSTWDVFVKEENVWSEDENYDETSQDQLDQACTASEGVV